MRIAVAGGYFKRGATPAALQGVARIAAALAVSAEVEIAEAARARAAAYILTAAEGAALHLDRLRSDAADFDPAVRDRLLAGAMLPAPFVARAQKFRRWYHAEVLKLFDSFDAIVAPATPFAAPRIGQQSVNLDGAELPLRPNIGIFTQPISFIGLPVVAVPVALQPLPIAVQIIAPPWREDVALRIAHSLEKAGVVLAPRPAK
jgi:aspartyl-tRNA(Asn)/glutamyl-tRNA(Gln) amidotransferase subunit A